MKHFLTLATAFLLFACAPSTEHQLIVPNGPWDEWAEKNPSWVEPIEPYHVFGNIYYVGSKGLGAYLITGNEGHILLDGGLPQNAPLIVESVEALGYDIKDVKILLNSHAHFDHSGGLAYLKTVTGAKLYASADDKPWLENGFYPGALEKLEYSAPPVMVDQALTDNETVALGTITLLARPTPGHSPGCTSWSLTAQHDGKTYDVLIFGSATVAGNNLVPEQYPGIIEDFERTFKKVKTWHPDIVVSNHPDFFFDQETKMKRKQAGDAMAFVDKEIFQVQMKSLEAQFQKRLKAERNKP